MEQKLDYLHNNPVDAEIIEVPEAYLYSSARGYAGQKGVLDIELLNNPIRSRVSAALKHAVAVKRVCRKLGLSSTLYPELKIKR